MYVLNDSPQFLDKPVWGFFTSNISALYGERHGWIKPNFWNNDWIPLSASFFKEYCLLWGSCCSSGRKVIWAPSLESKSHPKRGMGTWGNIKICELNLGFQQCILRGPERLVALWQLGRFQSLSLLGMNLNRIISSNVFKNPPFVPHS